MNEKKEAAWCNSNIDWDGGIRRAYDRYESYARSHERIPFDELSWGSQCHPSFNYALGSCVRVPDPNGNPKASKFAVVKDYSYEYDYIIVGFASGGQHSYRVPPEDVNRYKPNIPSELFDLAKAIAKEELKGE